MSVGDRVRVVRIPAHLPDSDWIYEKCEGRVFVVDGFDGDGWVEIDVGQITGRAFDMIAIEPECLEVIEEGVFH